MTAKELLQTKSRFGYKMFQFGLEDIMRMLEKGTYEILDDDESIPQNISVFKLAKKIPVRLVCISEERENMPVQIVVQGGCEIKNLIDWVKNDTPVIIKEKECRFSEFSEEAKKAFLGIHGFANIIISQNNHSETEKLTREQMIQLARDFV